MLADLVLQLLNTDIQIRDVVVFLTDFRVGPTNLIGLILNLGLKLLNSAITLCNVSVQSINLTI